MLALFLLHFLLPDRLPVVEGLWFTDLRHLLCYIGGFLLVRHLHGRPWMRIAAPLWAVLWMGAQIAFGLLHPVEFPFYIFTAFGLFAWMDTWHIESLPGWVTFLSKASYGIYLGHAAVISLVVRLTGNWIPVAASPFSTAFVTLAVMTAGLWLAQKIHLQKWVM